MTLAAVRVALETAVGAMQPALLTAWENRSYSPTPGVPYQAIHLLPAEPMNSEIGNARHTESGIFHIRLCYPKGTGSAAAIARAELIRSTFYRGATFSSSGVTVHVETTPEIAPGRVEEDRYVVPVRVRFYAHILRS